MTTITLWLMPNAGFESQRVIDQELALFHRANPGIEVNCEILSWSNAWSRLIQAVKEKAGPDVIQVGTTWIGTLGYLGAVHKLDGRRIPTETFIPTFFSMCQCFDHVWAVPWFCEGRVLFYRRDLLARAGLGPEDIADWKRFKSACARLGRGRKTAPMGFSCQKEQAVLQDLAGWIWSNGGDFLSQDGKHASINQYEARQGIKYFLDLIAGNAIADSSLEQTAGAVVENFFRNDAYAFLLSSSWPLQVYLNRSSKNFIGKEKAGLFGVAPVPEGPAGRFNFAGGSGLSITSFSKNPDKAWKLVDYLTSKEPLARYCKNINMFPSRTDVSAALQADGESKKVFQDSINSSGRSFPSHPLWGSIEQVIVNGLVQMLRNFRQNPHQTFFFQNLSDINQEIEYILSVFGD
ncbi:MAG: extracellular solute-binding protein [Endomicrobiales bacterium]